MSVAEKEKINSNPFYTWRFFNFFGFCVTHNHPLLDDIKVCVYLFIFSSTCCDVLQDCPWDFLIIKGEKEKKKSLDRLIISFFLASGVCEMRSKFFRV